MVVSDADIVPILKISPLLFSILLDLLSIDYNQNWDAATKNYFGTLQHSGYVNEGAKWRYRHLATYLHDKVQSKTTLVTSFVYAGVVHIIEYDRSPAYLLLGVVLVLSGILSFVIVNRWFKIESGSRNPDSYYKYYYEKREADKVIKREYINSYLRPKYDRYFSPRNSSLIANILLVITVLGIEFTTTYSSLIITFLTISIIYLIAFLTSPGYPKN